MSFLLALPGAGCTDGGGDLPPAPDGGADLSTPAPPWLQPFLPSPRGRFPAGFLFGSATSPYQIEGGLSNTDWGQFEAGHIANNDHADQGPQSRQNYLEDVQALASSKQNAYRFGIEWARLFPTAAAWTACRSAAPKDRLASCRAAAPASELAYYHDLLSQLAGRSITPLVTLVHSSLPAYIDDAQQDFHTQGWLSPTIVSDLGIWADFAVREFGADVHYWVTLNEPLTDASAAYLSADHPPAQKADFDSFMRAAGQMARAAAAMYDAIHAVDSKAWVSIAQDVHLYYAETPGRPQDEAAVRRTFHLANEVILDALARGDLDADFSGTLDPGEPHNDPTLRGRLDYVGVNYYGFSIIEGLPGIPLTDGIPLSDQDDHGLPKNDLGWDLYPRGLAEAVRFAASYKLPVILTENGLADAGDVNRPRFVAEHLAQVAALLMAGVDIRGYFHWALLDNFEWTSGFCPRFGLYAVDRSDPARKRTPRPSATTYQQIIEAGEVSDALLASQPAYGPPSVRCGN